MTDLGVGPQLRGWRERRRLSQLDLACEAGVSARHLSFVETGRARPSRDMVLLLSRRLDVPLRARNALLLAAGYAPLFAERGLESPAMAGVRRAVQIILTAHQPYPAMAIDRTWTMVAANAAVAPLLAGVAPALLEAPVNVLRLSLHPDGLAPRILNLPEWRAHLMERLNGQITATADPSLIALEAELRDYPVAPSGRANSEDYGGVAVPLRLQTPNGVLTFLSTTTVFGAPRDVTLSELALETFFPADAETTAALSAV